MRRKSAGLGLAACVVGGVASVPGAMARGQVAIDELYRDGTVLTAQRASTLSPIAGLGPAVDGGSVFEYIFTSVPFAPEDGFSSLVQFRKTGVNTIVAEQPLGDPVASVGFLPVAADGGVIASSLVSGPATNLFLDAIGIRRPDGTLLRVGELGMPRPGGGTFGSGFLQQLRGGEAMWIDREQVGFSFINDGVFAADASTGVTRRVIAVGEAIESTPVVALLGAALGGDGSVAAVVEGADDIARLVVIERSGTRTVVAREGDIGRGGAASRVFVSAPTWTPSGWIFSGGFGAGGTIDQGVFRFDGVTIETVIDGSFAFAASSDEVGNAFLLVTDRQTRRLEVLKPDGGRVLVYDSADLLDGLDASLIGFGADAIDDGVVAFTANVRDPSDPARPAVSVAYRAVIRELMPCLGDVNGDGLADPFDLSSWILAFNNNGPACDQNGDGLCSASDFTSWIDNFNDGCP